MMSICLMTNNPESLYLSSFNFCALINRIFLSPRSFTSFSVNYPVPTSSWFPRELWSHTSINKGRFSSPSQSSSVVMSNIFQTGLVPVAASLVYIRCAVLSSSIRRIEKKGQKRRKNPATSSRSAPPHNNCIFSFCLDLFTAFSMTWPHWVPFYPTNFFLTC